MYWQNTKKLRYFFALISIIVVASLVNIVGLGNNRVSALTGQQCYDQFNGLVIDWTKPMNPLDKAILDGCKAAGDCKEVAQGTTGKVIACTDPVQDAASTAAAKAEIAPLIAAACGVAPPIFNQTSTYITCSNKVVAAYSSCSMSGGPVTSSVLNDPATTAACFVKKVPMKLAVAKTAITQGRTDSDKITTAAADAKLALDCAKPPKYGTVVKGVCVPKAAEVVKATCTIDGVGWIICPVMNFMAWTVDGAYGVVGTLLTTPVINTNTSDPANTTYKAWAIMRTIANVAFVIAFLIIIFSQLTSVGITNYGVKKMLPRLIIAAILVNASYFICAISVDVSNILGSSTKQLFDGIGGQLTMPVIKAETSQTGSGWAGAVGFLLAGGLATTAALYAGLSVLLPALIAALVAIVTVFLVLTLRQALIIILIVISPLAFVAFLLPNTESLFKKWRELLTTLLLMFPIIAAIFGGSALASTIIMTSSTSFAVQVMGALVAIIPLFITPVVMKSAGGLLNRFGGIVNNPNKGPFDRMRKGAEGYRNNRQEYRNLKAMNGENSLPGSDRWARRKAGRAAILNNRKGELNRSNADYIAKRSATDEGFRDQLAEGGGAGAVDRAKAASLNVRLKLENEEIEQAMTLMVDSSDPTELQGNVEKAFKEATESGETTKARAAQKILATQLGAPGIQTLHKAISEVETSGKGNAGTMVELKKDINSLGLKGKDNAIASWGYTPGTNMQMLEANTGTYSGLNPVELAGQNEMSLTQAELIGAISVEQAKFTLANPGAAQLLSGKKLEVLHRIANGTPPPPPATP